MFRPMRRKSKEISTGLALVKRLAMKYYPDEAHADEEIASSGAAVQLFVIEIEHMTSKEIQER